VIGSGTGSHSARLRCGSCIVRRTFVEKKLFAIRSKERKIVSSIVS